MLASGSPLDDDDDMASLKNTFNKSNDNAVPLVEDGATEFENYFNLIRENDADIDLDANNKEHTQCPESSPDSHVDNEVDDDIDDDGVCNFSNLRMRTSRTRRNVRYFFPRADILIDYDEYGDDIPDELNNLVDIKRFVEKKTRLSKSLALHNLRLRKRLEKAKEEYYEFGIERGVVLPDLVNYLKMLKSLRSLRTIYGKKSQTKMEVIK
jgi:hypothetical protein